MIARSPLTAARCERCGRAFSPYPRENTTTTSADIEYCSCFSPPPEVAPSSESGGIRGDIGPNQPNKGNFRRKFGGVDKRLDRRFK